MTVSSKSPSFSRSIGFAFMAELLQFVLELILNHVKQVHAGRRAPDAVGLVGINHESELFACLDEGVDHLHAILKMNIVITAAVDQEQRAVQLVGCSRHG